MRCVQRNWINMTYRIYCDLGLWSVVVAVASLPLIPNRLLSAPSSLSLISWSMILTTSSVTLIAVWATVTAVSLLPQPTLLSMVRSTEIPLSLVTEALYWSAVPGPVSVLGSIIVSHIIINSH